MSCKVAFLRLHRAGHIQLPPPQKPANNHLKTGKRTLLALPRPEVRKKAGEHTLQLELVEKADSALWNEYIDRYHYLGYTPLPGPSCGTLSNQKIRCWRSWDLGSGMEDGAPGRVCRLGCLHEKEEPSPRRQ